MNIRCETCRFYDRSYFIDMPVSDVGECRRFPPPKSGKTDSEDCQHISLFPFVVAGDWCGEWLPINPSNPIVH